MKLALVTTQTAAFAIVIMLPYSVSGAEGEKAELHFARHVLPILKAKCFACHGNDDELRGEFNMLSRDGLLKGGESGEPALIPGKPTDSLIYQAVNWDGLEMPPKENDRLTNAQIGQLRVWIESGAPWPNAERLKQLERDAESRPLGGVQVRTSGGLSDDWTNRTYDPRNLWAYQPLQVESPVPDPKSGLNAVDFFIGTRLDQLGIDAAPPADRRTLIRRATFDLIGLPPTPEEVEAFVRDSADDDEAFEKVVNRLLASPHYGERWAMHWLDVVRYADSSGFANDYERGNAWRYRDYVIRAFNNDKPYDQFTREQLAGDEMDPDDPEMLVAVGFLRMGPWELTGMEVAKVARQRFLDDVTDAVGQVFLGHMLQCARCHDHKFDPVPTRDYYSLQAVFSTTQLAERRAAFLPEENTGGFEERKYLEARQVSNQRMLDDVNKKETIAAARKWFTEQGVDSTEFEAVLASLSERNNDVGLQQVRTAMAKRGIGAELIPPKKSGFEPQDFGLERIGRKTAERLAWRLERYKPVALSVYSGKTRKLKRVSAPMRVPEDSSVGELEQTAILVGGDPFSPSHAVSPGALSAVDVPTALGGAALPADTSGRRLALADWITSPGNPLTARVMVNRIWQWHFGKAIAGNPNNFGETGKKPTHPELLDYLAKRFMDEGWSTKAMHRLIMNSAAYKRSSRHPQMAAVGERDPQNEAYAVFLPRRLSAEELRDTMLAVSGELNRDLGGIPVRPEMNLEAALQPRMVMGTFAEAWQPSPLPRQRHRRSIYALRIRGQRDPFLEVFNSPSPDLSCEAREASTVTPQVFSMFNSELTFDRALALAKRVSTSTRTAEETVKKLFELAFGRAPTATELIACTAHWEKMTKRHATLKFDAPRYPGEVVREAVEENTGVKFTFTEPLEFYSDFVPDLKPSDASPELRGLAEVCLVLINSNEFTYIY